jgi:CubicO group peptidase (beta-lactamase class C family)
MPTKISTRFDESDIDRIFAAVDQCHLPGAAVGIAIEGVPVYRKGFGLANIELPTLLTPSMRMRIGSTTKHFAALAYMLLCEEGHADIDDEIGRYVPGLKPVNARATMRRLMGHTSGIRDALEVTMLFNGTGIPVTDSEMIAYYETIEDADFEPGARWRYNNGGYILLNAAIENITGQPLDDVLRERIFTPVGMNDTLLRRWDQDFVSNSATLHFRNAAGQWSRTYMGMEISGAGGMVSTMDDMLRWLKHLRAPFVGSAETWRLMREPQLLNTGHSTGYGLGLFTERYRGVEVTHHAGGVMGGNSQMITVPEAGLDISIAVNRSDVSAITLAYSVIDACIEGLDPLSEPAIYEKRTGTFRSARDGRVVTLTATDDAHLLSLDGGTPLPVSPDAEGVLRLPAAASFLQQSVQIDGEAIVHSDFGLEDQLTEIETDSEAKLGAHAGSYRSDAVDTTIELSEDEHGARARSRGRHGSAVYVMTPISADIWRIEDRLSGTISAVIAFDADGRGLSLSFARMRDVRFRKVG